MDLRDGPGGQLCKGVTVGDMGGKTTGNDLDNAWIKFEKVGVVCPLTAVDRPHSHPHTHTHTHPSSHRCKYPRARC